MTQSTAQFTQLLTRLLAHGMRISALELEGCMASPAYAYALYPRVGWNKLAETLRQCASTHHLFHAWYAMG